MSSWSLVLTPCRENITPASGGQVDPSHPIKMPHSTAENKVSSLQSSSVWLIFVLGFVCFFFISFVTNLCKRLSFLWKDARRSFNPAPKSPYSAPLQVYTVAFVYKVQDHTFYRVTTMFLVLIWDFKWGFVFDLVLFLMKMTLWPFLLGRNGYWYRV